VTERALTLHNGSSSIAFEASDRIRGPLDALRRDALNQGGKPPLSYALIALGTDGGEMTDEVWVDE